MKIETLKKYIGNTYYDLNIFLNKVKDIYNNFYNKSSTTISKESTSEAIADGKGESLNTKVKENDIV